MTAWIPENGLRFECTGCGACCTGPPGYVTYTPDEGRDIAKHLGLAEDRFLERYTHDTPAGRSLKEHLTEHGYDCVFLDRESVPGKAVCSIYEHRPLQCRTFPWWPEHLRSQSAWRQLGRECEGVGRGDFVPLSEITIEAKRQTSRDANVNR